MTKTLADMTVKERQACVGMWCNFIDFDDSNGYEFQTGSLCPQLGIIIRLPEFDDEFEVTVPASGCEQVYVPERNITPRFDLPRAWNPDGTPPKGEWEEGWCYTGGTPTGDYACLIETQDGTAYTSEETPTGDIRRFIHEWENTNV